jgi:hypothetical protein
MNNRILGIEVRDHVLTPASAEVRVLVRTEFRTPATEIRGRLMGPRCLFASTVEVAYPLRALPTPAPSAGGEFVLRVIIPEASLWDPQSPFLYAGPVELWEGDRRCDVARVTHGLRLLRCRPTGFFLNGRSFAVRGMEVSAACSDDDGLRLRHAGYNLLIAPVAEATVPLWDLGDRLGFLVVGRLGADDPAALDRVAELRRHASCAGWVAASPDVRVDGIVPLGALGLSGSSD